MSRLGSRSPGWWSRQATTSIDPREVRLPRTPVDEAAVRHYRDQPDVPYDPRDHDGDPCVVIGHDGVAELRNGKHRALAALAEGRQLKVRVVDERRS